MISDLGTHKLAPIDCGIASPREPVNAFTVDVEDYYHVSAFEKWIPRSDWDRYESRVEQNTHHLLEVLDRHDVRATFFVLGWVAERYPHLVREIGHHGHEIGCHGYSHRLIYEQSPCEFREDVRRSREILEDIVTEPVTCYRAPSFSITKRSLWAVEILAEMGFTASSSVYPIHHDRYGIPDANPSPHLLNTPSGPLWEFPATVVRFAGYNFPVGGGGYFRLYPIRWTLRLLRRVQRATRQPLMFYIHPWEIDPDQPRLGLASPMSRFRHYVNLHKTEGKLELLLKSFRFGRISDSIRNLCSASGSRERFC
jgi:polysaccharide deacetylase family protein (PEP-CTERM system associated)